MNPDIEPLEPIDPPDNTIRRKIDDDDDAEPEVSEAQARAMIDPPDNTGGG